MQKVMYLDLQLNDGVIPIDVDLTVSECLDITFDASAGGRLPYYDGDYVVVPRKIEQELETKNKSMHENVVINAINYSETINPYGGETVIIGYE